VTVTATGLPAGTVVRLEQCDEKYGEYDCATSMTATTDANGALTAQFRVEDPVYRIQEFGDSTPIYCRADVCRIFVSWIADDGSLRFVASPTLTFTGSPATISRRPAGELRDGQSVKVFGTAIGAAGQQVRVVEQACYDLVQGSGCYGRLVLASTRVRPNGKWHARVRVHQLLADGTDCAAPDDILGTCLLVAEILDPSGVPDDSFGVSRIGDPSSLLSFIGAGDGPER
jgi:hypothetical protein